MSFTEIVGGWSSSVIVATPCASPIRPGDPTRFVRFTTNVSSASSDRSAVTGTEATLVEAVLLRVTVPDEAVKSAAVAEPGAVAHDTCSGQHALGWGDTRIVKFALVVPPVPSTTVTFEIVTDGVGAAAAGAGNESRSRAETVAPARRRSGAWRPRSPRTGIALSMGEISTEPGPRLIPDPGLFLCLGAGMDLRVRGQATCRAS